MSHENLFRDFHTAPRYAEGSGTIPHILTPTMVVAREKARKQQQEAWDRKASMTREEYKAWWHGPEGCCGCHNEDGQPV